MQKLLLTGASGFLGWNICKFATADWEVYGLVNKSEICIPKVKIRKLNLTDSSQLRKFFAEISPDAVIHTAAISDANYCQHHSEETYNINVVATQLLAELCAHKKIPFVFTSSDLVFDGNKGYYVESDAVNPVSKYGEQKVEAELLIQNVYPEAAICRMPLMIGDRGILKRGYLEAFLSKARNGEALKLFTDEYRSPLGGVSAAIGLLHAIKNFKGIYHLGGKERLSRFELGEIIASVFKISNRQLVPVKQREMKMFAPRPADVSLNSEKANSGGFKPQPIKDELQTLSLQGILQNFAPSHKA